MNGEIVENRGRGLWLVRWDTDEADSSVAHSRNLRVMQTAGASGSGGGGGGGGGSGGGSGGDDGFGGEDYEWDDEQEEEEDWRIHCTRTNDPWRRTWSGSRWAPRTA